MRLLMVSGDRQVTIGEQGPFYSMQREFSRYFERVDVICPKPPRAPTVLTIHDNVHFHPAECGRTGMVRYIERMGIKLASAFAPSLIVSHDYGWFYNGIGSARLATKTGLPYLSELHHVPGYPVPADLRERLDKWMARQYVRYALPRAAAFRVVNSTEMPALLHEWRVPEEKILVLPSLYIDLEVFRPASEPVPFEQEITYVGRMANNKGLDRIVDALAMLRRRSVPHRSLFVGKGKLAKKVRDRAARAGLGDSVRFIDWIDTPEELAEVYRRSQVVVCASTCEGGPRFTVEAMACGTPVISTPVGVMTELLRDGTAGCLTDFTSRGLADMLQIMLENGSGRNQLGLQACALAQQFEYSRAIGAYAQGLIDLASRFLSLQGSA